MKSTIEIYKEGGVIKNFITCSCYSEFILLEDGQLIDLKDNSLTRFDSNRDALESIDPINSFTLIVEHEFTDHDNY